MINWIIGLSCFMIGLALICYSLSFFIGKGYTAGKMNEIERRFRTLDPHHREPTE